MLAAYRIKKHCYISLQCHLSATQHTYNDQKRTELLLNANSTRSTNSIFQFLIVANLNSKAKYEKRKKTCKLIRNQLNKKLKLMVETQDMLYTLTCPLTREPIGLEVWIRTCAEYSTLNEGWLRFEPATFPHTRF